MESTTSSGGIALGGNAMAAGIGGSSCSSSNELWVNKYAPKCFRDAVGNCSMLSVLQQYTFEPEAMPSMILAGPPGCGKTTALHILAHTLHGDQKEQCVLEMNASDQRGIDVVRDTITNWLRTYVKLKNQEAYRIVFLDEFDSMTMPAQEALRKVMEQNTHRARFALACNHPNKILDAIISRCSVLKFQKIEPVEMLYRVVQVARFEGLSYDAEGLDALIFIADGDMRKAITMLQAVADRVRDDDDPVEVVLSREGEGAGMISSVGAEDHDVAMTDAAVDDVESGAAISTTNKKDHITNTDEAGADAQAAGSSKPPSKRCIDVTKANVLKVSDAPNPELLKGCLKTACLVVIGDGHSFHYRLERAGYPLRDVMVWLGRVALHSLEKEIDDVLRAEIVHELSIAHANMVRSDRFSLLQLDALFFGCA